MNSRRTPDREFETLLLRARVAKFIALRISSGHDKRWQIAKRRGGNKLEYWEAALVGNHRYRRLAGSREDGEQRGQTLRAGPLPMR